MEKASTGRLLASAVFACFFDGQACGAKRPIDEKRSRATPSPGSRIDKSDVVEQMMPD